jgi:N-acetylneuraminic acid mutarotase
VDAWAALAPAPLVRERDWSATWTGKEVIFWGGLDGDGTATADGVALDTAAMTWRLVPGAPLVGRTGHAAAYGGGRLWVWGGVGADEGMRNDGAAFDPSAGTWQVLPAAPLSPRSHATMVWTGDGLLVWGGRGHADAGADTPTLVDGARYRPGEGWTRIADAPTAYAGAPAVLWTGASSCPNERACAKLLVWGTPAPGLHLRDGYLYDLATDTWSELPNLLSQTRRDAVALWTGEHAVVWGGVDWRGAPARRDGFIYEPVSERWVQIPRLPLDTEPGATVVLMGDALLVVGDAGGGRYPLREPIERLAASP